MAPDAVRCYPCAADLGSHMVAAHGVRSVYLAWVWTTYDPETGAEQSSTCRACQKAFPARAVVRGGLAHRASCCRRAADEGLVKGLVATLASSLCMSSGWP